MSKSHELEHLTGLMRDFPVRLPWKPKSTEKAWNSIRNRWRALQASEINPTDFIAISIDNLKSSIDENEVFIHTLHLYSFRGILSNAGEYRKSTDPNNGKVYFGGQLRSEARQKFEGTSPPKIKAEVRGALNELMYEDRDPIENALRFYQLFVRCHPFYDANGRIGRFLMTQYLQLMGYQVLWADLKGGDKSKFIKKLNACHNHYGKHDYDRYLGYLVDYFRRHVVPVSDYEE